MFKINPNPTFDIWVSGFVPGGTKADGLTVTFRYKTAAEFAQWLESLKTKTLLDATMDIVDGWKDAPHEFSAEAVEKIHAAYPAFIATLVDAYRRELFEAKAKN